MESMGVVTVRGNFYFRKLGKEEKIRLDGDLMVKHELGKCTQSLGRPRTA